MPFAKPLAKTFAEHLREMVRFSSRGEVLLDAYGRGMMRTSGSKRRMKAVSPHDYEPIRRPLTQLIIKIKEMGLCKNT